MDDTKSKIAIALLGPILDAFKNKDSQNAVQAAGALTFWRDGMLETLRVIAARKADLRTFGTLRRQYEKSAEGVDKAKAMLLEAREKFAGSPVADQIDAILHSDAGKMTIRGEIEHLLYAVDHGNTLKPDDELFELTWRNITEDADHICKGIELFNAEVRRLHRMVYGA